MEVSINNNAHFFAYGHALNDQELDGPFYIMYIEHVIEDGGSQSNDLITKRRSKLKMILVGTDRMTKTRINKVGRYSPVSRPLICLCLLVRREDPVG